MSRKDGKFDFKRFSVAHTRSSMKVGVDGVLVALWSELPEAGNILDVGCGCGVISLICAQRSENCATRITAIDVDIPSVEEARENFLNSPWADRLSVLNIDFNNFEASSSGKFGLIISNPPYFDSGVEAGESRRLTARHQGSLSPSVLIESAPHLLIPGGTLSMVVPAEFVSRLESEAAAVGLHLSRTTSVRGHANAPVKRALLQFKCRGVENVEILNNEVSRDELVLEETPGIPTDAYRLIGAPFYLKF